MDIVRPSPPIEEKDYLAEEDPTVVASTRTDRIPLPASDNWKDRQPMMCCYKVGSIWSLGGLGFGGV